jgi:hypothetical protein
MSAIECPVCSEAAHTVLDLSEDGLRCACPRCGEFALSDASSITLARYTGNLRRGLLNAAIARAKPGQVPVISHTD